MKKKLVFCLLFFIFALCTPSLSAWVIASSIGNTIEKVEDPSLIDVAFLDSAPDNKYKSIEKAIETANNSTTTERVQVIVGTNPTIKKNITINSNVTLNIPYADGVENSERVREADASMHSFSLK